MSHQHDLFFASPGQINVNTAEMKPEDIVKQQQVEYRRMRETPHNIVFLDVDGVLNTVVTRERSPMNYIGIQPSRVRILHIILEQNDAILVLTTSWKRTWNRTTPVTDTDRDVCYMVGIFADESVFACDKTVDDGYDRGKGIAGWLSDHPHKGWIVLDDEIFCDYRDYGILAHLIRTSCSPNGGLKEKHIRIAAALFDKQASGVLGTEPRIPDYAVRNHTNRTRHHFGKA